MVSLTGGNPVNSAVGRHKMTYPEFELFLKPSPEFLEGERQLVEAGRNSIAKLSAFFTGEAKNEFGVEYRKLAQAMTCALETARRLGPIAKPLESHLRQQLAAGNHTAAMALGALGTLEEASVKALASAMGVAHPQQMHLAAESAVALMRCGKGTHPAFIAAQARLAEGSPIARIVNKWRLS